MHNANTKVILNIGTAIPRGGRITPNAILHHVQQYCFENGNAIIDSTIRMSATEETVVVELEHPVLLNTMFDLSVVLWQDCIAIYSVATARGYLRGPKADQWGAFDATRFIMPDGEPLEPRILRTVPHGTYAGQKFKHPQPLPLDADSAIWSVEDSHRLASLGIFSIDRTEHRKKREREAAEEERIAGAYRYLRLDRGALYGELAKRVPQTPGIWIYSTGAYHSAKSRHDRDVLEMAREAGYKGAA